MQKQYEKQCPKLHSSIAEAIRCAEESLGFQHLPVEPYWGTTRFTLGWVVGWQSGTRKRWRLDYEDRTTNGKPPKFIHVNEENFEKTTHEQKVVHRVDSTNLSGGLQVDLLYRKWTSRFDLPEKVQEELAFERALR